MRVSQVLREALGNTVFLTTAFLLAFPLLGPAFLWLLVHFFSALDVFQGFLGSLKG